MNPTARTPRLRRLAITAGLSWLALAFTARALPVVQTVFYDMLDRRTTAILFHGSADYLLSADLNQDPIGGSLYPMKQVLASAAQAAALGLPNPIVRHYVMDHLPAPVAERMFFRLHSRPAEAPVDEPENAGFFLSYDDFDL